MVELLCYNALLEGIMAKYRNTKHKGFDSKGEYQRYHELLVLQNAGAIQNLSRQPRFVLQPAFKRHGKTIRKIEYVADFTYSENGKQVVEDFKGFKTAVFCLKEKLFQYQYPDIELRITKGNRR